MSAKWMRIETDFVDHPKVHRLAALLNEPLADAYVLRAWSWLSRFCPTGQVRDGDEHALEVTCRWRGAPGALVAGLVQVGFLSALPGGGWEAHDWADHQGKVAANAEKERKRKADYRARKAAEAAELSRGTTQGRPALRDVTGRDVTERDGTEEEAHQPQPAVAAFEVQPPDPTAMESWSKEDFWRAAELTRRSLGYAPEKWPTPKVLSKWWSEARGVAEMKELAIAFQRFAVAKHWAEATPPAPFVAFASKWNEFLPRRAS